MGPRKTSKTRELKSQELISTLSQLENAIRDWEATAPQNQVKSPSTLETQEQQAPQLAQSLLKKLREQIDALSD